MGNWRTNRFGGEKAVNMIVDMIDKKFSYPMTQVLGRRDVGGGMQDAWPYGLHC